MTAAVDPAEPSAAELAKVALRHPAVVRLHPGRYGEVGTYLPGRRVVGVRVTVDEVEIHLVVALGVPVRRVADEVRTAVRPLIGDRPVHVVIGDVEEIPDLDGITEVVDSGSSQVDGR